MLPLLIVYFCVGLSGMTTIAETLFNKDFITLDAAQLISLGIWTSLPWSIKILFGSTIDSMQLFGNKRKSYIIAANLMILLSCIMMVDMASTKYLTKLLGEYGALVAAGLLSSVGTVIARLVADILAIETAKTDEEKAKFQVNIRNAFVAGGLVGAVIAGPLATHFSVATVFAMSMICPLISIACILPLKIRSSNRASVDSFQMAFSIVFSILCTGAALSLSDASSQLVIFFLTLFSVSFLLGKQLIESQMSRDLKKYLVVSLVAIFLFRTTPGVGPSLRWYYMDQLGFDASFLGFLNVIGASVSLALMWFLRDYMATANTKKVLVWLTVALTILGIPDILIYYGYTGGISARHLVLIDNATSVAMAQLAMVPLGVIVAQCAPENKRATYLALTSSLMNLALVVGDLITKWLNQAFIVTRTDFTQLGSLMIWSLVISTALSLLGIYVLKGAKKP